MAFRPVVAMAADVRCGDAKEMCNVRRRQAIKILDMMPDVDHKGRTILRAVAKFTSGKARTCRTKRIIRRRVQREATTGD